MAELALSSGFVLTTAGAVVFSAGLWGWSKVSLRFTLMSLMAAQGFERAFEAAFANGSVSGESTEPQS